MDLYLKTRSVSSYRDTSCREYTNIYGGPREQKHRDVQTVGADSLWRFRMRIYVLVRDVNNARDAVINPQRDPLLPLPSYVST